MLKKSASVVLASFRSSTYPRGYASGLHSLRPCWTAFLSLLRDGHSSSGRQASLHVSPSHLPHTLRSSGGFTILEIIIVLFLLVGLLGIILPRISLEENLGTVGRQMVRTVRSLQSLAMATQKTSPPVRRYGQRGLLAGDPGWESGKDADRPPYLGHAVTTPRHHSYFRYGGRPGTKRLRSGRSVLLPDRKIDPATMHLVDTRNNHSGHRH